MAFLAACLGAVGGWGGQKFSWDPSMEGVKDFFLNRRGVCRFSKWPLLRGILVFLPIESMY